MVLFKYLWLMAISEHPSCSASEQHKEIEALRGVLAFLEGPLDPSSIPLRGASHELERERDEGWPDTGI